MSHYQQPPMPMPPVQQRRSGIPGLIVALIGVLCLAFGCAGGAMMGSGSTDKPASASVQDAPASGKPSTSSGPAKPKPVEVGPGTLEIPGDMKPGKYRTKESGCYWARLRNTSGGLDSIVANGNTSGLTTVTIGKTDKAFETTCEWTKA